jgi:hypothetical protein
MQYHGLLYGHIPGTRKYFETGKGSADWDRMESKIATQADSIKRISERLMAHDMTLSDIGKILGDETMSSAEIIKRVSALANVVVSHTGALPDSQISKQVTRPGVGL